MTYELSNPTPSADIEGLNITITKSEMFEMEEFFKDLNEAYNTFTKVREELILELSEAVLNQKFETLEECLKAAHPDRLHISVYSIYGYHMDRIEVLNIETMRLRTGMVSLTFENGDAVVTKSFYKELFNTKPTA